MAAIVVSCRSATVTSHTDNDGLPQLQRLRLIVIGRQADSPMAGWLTRRWSERRTFTV